MGQVGKKLRSYGTSGTSRGFAHWCPACGEAHIFITEQRQAGGPQWTFDGNFDAPTFGPSMKITGKQTVQDDKGEWTGEWVRDESGATLDLCCHYYLRAGMLDYLNDCTHALKGQKIELPELPPHLRD